jgi:hypothetical protein
MLTVDVVIGLVDESGQCSLVARCFGGQAYLDRDRQDFCANARKLACGSRTDIFAFKCSCVLVLILNLSVGRVVRETPEVVLSWRQLEKVESTSIFDYR